MINRIVSLLQLRQSTAFLLARGDDRLLDDIGLSRADLEAMRISGVPSMHDIAHAIAFPSGRALPVAA
jgi:hypothetical protein